MKNDKLAVKITRDPDGSLRVSRFFGDLGVIAQLNGADGWRSMIVCAPRINGEYVVCKEHGKLISVLQSKKINDGEVLKAGASVEDQALRAFDIALEAFIDFLTPPMCELWGALDPGVTELGEKLRGMD